MKTRLEYTDAKSNKFWEIQTKGSAHTVCYGKIGTDGRSKTKQFDSPAAAKADADKLTQQKLKKGYAAVGGGAPVKKTPAKKTPAKKTPAKKTPAKKTPTKKTPTKKTPAKKTPAKKATAKKKTAESPADRFAEVCLALPQAYQAEWSSGRRITGKRSFRIKKGEHREFAAWFDDGAQPGAHLRYADAKLLNDPRFARSRAHRGKQHNWMHVVDADADWAQLQPFVEASYKAAQQRGGGQAVAGKALYLPLRKGVEAAGDHRPEALHASGPAAKVTGQEGQSAFRLALWSVETVKHLVPRAEKQAFDGALEALHDVRETWEAIVAKYPPAQVRMGRGYETLSKTAGKLKNPEGESQPLLAARAAAGAFRCIPGGYSQRAVSFLAEAVEAVVRALLDAGETNTVRDYLQQLDDRVMLEEFAAVAAVRSKVDPPPVAQRVLWRGADDKGFPGLWLVRLPEAGSYALLWKAGRRWAFTPGGRDDVLASVPDAHFEAAVASVKARDV